MDNFITDELLEKTFLFCWKRISDKEDARDLAGEIIVDAMLVLRSGKKIENFYGLFWQIAHNKVVDFYRKKRPAKISLDDMENSLLGFDKSIGDYIKQEELDTLSKSMTQLANIHRDILVRYYIKNQSVKEIAAALKLPTGTVTSRLSDARKNLKETFETMENRSSKNEEKSKAKITDFELEFYGDASQPWMAVSSLIDRQILFLCREKSQTLAKLSKQMALPQLFIEDSLQKLIRANVLFEKKKGHYLTDFTIFPKSAIRKAEEINRQVSENLKIAQRFFDILTGMKDEVLKEDFYGNDFEWEYLLPYFIIRSDREFGMKTGGEYLREKYGKGLADRFWRNFYLSGYYEDEPDEASKKEDSIIGPGYNFEIYNLPDYGHIEVHNTINTMHYEKDGHSYSLDLDRLDWLNSTNAGLYLELIKNPEKILSEKEEVLVADMMNNGVLEKTSEGYKGNIPVISFDSIDKWCKIWHEKFKELSIEYYDALYKAQENLVLPYIRHDLLWASFWHVIPIGDRKSLDSMLMQYAIDNNMVRFEEGRNASCAAMVLLTE
ncbi:MAG: sigma-70 family RNA polymerase sigma factor [Treponema sp.]|nr:sigma-70 family RNA polymerase sigma factor [Treponema sp.]